MMEPNEMDAAARTIPVLAPIMVPAHKRVGTVWHAWPRMSRKSAKKRPERILLLRLVGSYGWQGVYTSNDIDNKL
jgi:hypothetical protein